MSVHPSLTLTHILPVQRGMNIVVIADKTWNKAVFCATSSPSKKMREGRRKRFYLSWDNVVGERQESYEKEQWQLRGTRPSVFEEDTFIYLFFPLSLSLYVYYAYNFCSMYLSTQILSLFKLRFRCGILYIILYHILLLLHLVYRGSWKQKIYPINLHRAWNTVEKYLRWFCWLYKIHS